MKEGLLGSKNNNWITTVRNLIIRSIIQLTQFWLFIHNRHSIKNNSVRTSSVEFLVEIQTIFWLRDFSIVIYVRACVG